MKVVCLPGPRLRLHNPRCLSPERRLPRDERCPRPLYASAVSVPRTAPGAARRLVGPLSVHDACSQSAASPPPTASKAGTCPSRGQAGCWRPACPEHTQAWKPPCPRGAGRGSPYTAALLWELQSPHRGRLLRALSPRGDTRGSLLGARSAAWVPPGWNHTA